MFVGNSDTAAPISTSPARSLENVRVRMEWILEHSGSGLNKETRAVLDRLETEREAWQQAADEETVGRWEHQQRLLQVHRALSEAKKELMAFKLIAVETSPASENKPDQIRILDVWRDNFERYAPCSEYEHPRSGGEQKKEPTL